MEELTTYLCDCISGQRHSHVLTKSEARSRGVHYDFLAASASWQPELSPQATDIEDAVRGALWGVFIGDALAAPLHWYYTWSAAQQHKKALYG